MHAFVLETSMRYSQGGPGRSKSLGLGERSGAGSEWIPLGLPLHLFLCYPCRYSCAWAVSDGG